jgi:hypothetical protein
LISSENAHLLIAGPCSIRSRRTARRAPVQPYREEFGAFARELAAAPVAGENPRMDLQPFHIDRFQPWTH